MKVLITLNNGEILIEEVRNITWKRNGEYDELAIYTHSKCHYFNASEVIDISVEEWR